MEGLELKDMPAAVIALVMQPFAQRDAGLQITGPAPAEIKCLGTRYNYSRNVMGDGQTIVIYPDDGRKQMLEGRIKSFREHKGKCMREIERRERGLQASRNELARSSPTKKPHLPGAIRDRQEGIDKERKELDRIDGEIKAAEKELTHWDEPKIIHLVYSDVKDKLFSVTQTKLYDPTSTSLDVVRERIREKEVYCCNELIFELGQAGVLTTEEITEDDVTKWLAKQNMEVVERIFTARLDDAGKRESLQPLPESQPVS